MNSLTKICLRKFDAFKRVVPCLPGKMKQHLHAYRRDDAGAMLILTLYFFIIFLFMAGLGLAVMRHEMNRAKLSVTTDAAILAAAGMPPGSTVAEIKAVVVDYFDKNGLASNLNPIDTDGIGVDDIVTSLNSTEVTASASMTMPTTLLRLVGVDTLIANTGGTAKIATPKLEVSLVLDVSGSMDGAKIAALIVAAKEFVTTILDSGPPGDISISLIPFSWGVSPPDTIFNALNVDQTHDYSNCIVFQQSDFDDTAIDPNTPFRQQIYTSRRSNGSNPADFGHDELDDFWRSCYTDPYFVLQPYSMSETALHDQIDDLVAQGFTSGHLGIKWGAALLDPAFQPIATALKANGEMNVALTDVPSNFGEPETLKIIVMMGDGANTKSRYFNDPNFLNDMSIPESHVLPDYRGPGSDLYEIHMVDGGGNPDDSRYYLRDPNESDPTEDQYFDIASGNDITGVEFADLENTLNGYDTSSIGGIPVNDGTPMTWEQAWGQMSPEYYDDIIGGNALSNEYENQWSITGAMKNPRMQSACSAAKSNGIVIYTIGFQVSVGGTAETELVNCAQSVANYSRATPATISDVFSAIASNVQNLRLTQ